MYPNIYKVIGYLLKNELQYLTIIYPNSRIRLRLNCKILLLLFSIITNVPFSYFFSIFIMYFNQTLSVVIRPHDSIHEVQYKIWTQYEYVQFIQHSSILHHSRDSSIGHFCRTSMETLLYTFYFYASIALGSLGLDTRYKHMILCYNGKIMRRQGTMTLLDSIIPRGKYNEPRTKKQFWIPSTSYQCDVIC